MEVRQVLHTGTERSLVLLYLWEAMEGKEPETTEQGTCLIYHDTALEETAEAE